MAAEFGDPLDGIGRLVDLEHVRLGLDDRRKPLTKDRMILDAQDANRAAVRHVSVCVRRSTHTATGIENSSSTARQ